MTLNYSQCDGRKCRDLIGWQVIAPAVSDYMLSRGKGEVYGHLEEKRRPSILSECSEDGCFF